MRPRGRTTVALVAGLAVLASALVVLTPALTRGPAAGAAVADNSDPDYATVEFSDPWDFSNRADFPGWGAQNFSSHTLANGVLDARVNQGGGLIMANAIAGSIPHSRSSTLHPIDAGTLKKVAFRMYADRSAAGGFFWYTCDHIIPSCQGGFPFTVVPGWNDYVFNIPAHLIFQGGRPWQGVIKGLRLVPSGSSPIHIMLDYLRLVPTSASSAPPLADVPLPVVDSPSAAGGLDYASLVRRNAWDMSQPSDIVAPENMAYGFTGSLLNGVNTGGNAIDAHFSLPLAGAIDGSRFHRLNFSVFYEGAFSLASGPGGGMLARVIWQTAGRPGVWQDTDDIVVYPGWNNISVDLATTPSWAITDPQIPVRIGWAGQQINSVRFDPHEDSGPRRFLVDNIRISEDAATYGGAYDIRFHDNAWAPGTTADIYTTTARGGFGGTQIASGIPVAQGVNAFHWAPTPLTARTVWVYVVLKRGSYQARTYAGGPLRVTASPSPRYGVSPFGSFEAASAGPAGVQVRGWAIDPDAGGPVAVHFWVDGRASVGAVTASGNRADVGAAYPGFGAAHGFDATVPVPHGTHSVCAYAINSGAGATKRLGCRNVTVRNNPFGSLEAVVPKIGYASIGGWAIDPNRTTPIDVHVWVDGRPFTVLTADRDRPDIARAYPGFGAAHGYQADLALPSGAHKICTYGINEGPGGSVLLRCKTVALRSNPLGTLDVVRSTTGGIQVSGWAIDPDVSGPIDVHLYVTGGGAFPVRADAPRPDLVSAFANYGASHGFVTTLPGSSARHTICAYGINRGAGASIKLGCKTG